MIYNIANGRVSGIIMSSANHSALFLPLLSQCLPHNPVLFPLLPALCPSHNKLRIKDQASVSPGHQSFPCYVSLIDITSITGILKEEKVKETIFEDMLVKIIQRFKTKSTVHEILKIR